MNPEAIKRHRDESRGGKDFGNPTSARRQQHAFSSPGCQCRPAMTLQRCIFILEGFFHLPASRGRAPPIMGCGERGMARMESVVRSAIFLTACVRSRMFCGNTAPKLSYCQGDWMNVRARFCFATIIFFLGDPSRDILCVPKVNGDALRSKTSMRLGN